MDRISFTSGIKPVYTAQFYNEVTGYGKKAFVNHPWTYQESVRAVRAYTDRLSDCIMLGITNGQDIFMMHLDPENPINQNFNYLKHYILSKVDIKNKELNAILVGSQPTQKSQKLYGMLQDFLKELNITYSELKNGITPVSVAYSSFKDTYFISGHKIDYLLKKGLDSKNTLENAFDYVKISNLDEII